MFKLLSINPPTLNQKNLKCSILMKFFLAKSGLINWPVYFCKSNHLKIKRPIKSVYFCTSTYLNIKRPIKSKKLHEKSDSNWNIFLSRIQYVWSSTVHTEVLFMRGASQPCSSIKYLSKWMRLTLSSDIGSISNILDSSTESAVSILSKSHT